MESKKMRALADKIDPRILINRPGGGEIPGYTDLIAASDALRSQAVPVESEKAQEFAALAENELARLQERFEAFVEKADGNRNGLGFSDGDYDFVRIKFAWLAFQACYAEDKLAHDLLVDELRDSQKFETALRSQSGYVDGWRAGREAAAKWHDERAEFYTDCARTRSMMDEDIAEARANAHGEYARNIRALPLPEPNDGWRGIESAPKGQKIIAGYWNELGNWRSVMACYYLAGTLDIYEDSFETEDGFAPEGWYEESETHEKLLPMTTPTHWRPLPEPPIEEKL